MKTGLFPVVNRGRIFKKAWVSPSEMMRLLNWCWNSLNWQYPWSQS